MEPTRVVRLLLSHFNAFMPKMGVTLQINEMVRLPEFFEAVQHIITRLSDNVCKLELNFPSDNGRLSSMNRDHSLDVLKELQDFLDTFAYRGHLSAMVRNNRSFMSARNRHVWGLIAQLCTQNAGYYLRVKFENFGWYEYGQETTLQLGIGKDAIDRFVGREIAKREEDLFIDDDELPVVKLQSLRVWLEDITKLEEKYEERKVSKRKGTRRYRRSV